MLKTRGAYHDRQKTSSAQIWAWNIKKKKKNYTIQGGRLTTENIKYDIVSFRVVVVTHTTTTPPLRAQWWRRWRRQAAWLAVQTSAIGNNSATGRAAQRRGWGDDLRRTACILRYMPRPSPRRARASVRVIGKRRENITSRLPRRAPRNTVYGENIVQESPGAAVTVNRFLSGLANVRVSENISYASHGG